MMKPAPLRVLSTLILITALIHTSPASFFDRFKAAAYNPATEKRNRGQEPAGSKAQSNSESASLNVQIISPPPDKACETTGGWIEITGTATSQAGITSITWSNDRGGDGLALGGFDWKSGSIPLRFGANLITVTVTDSSNQSASASVTINRTENHCEQAYSDDVRSSYYRGVPVTYSVVEDMAIFDGDIILGSADEMEIARDNPGIIPQSGVISQTTRKWPGGIIPYATPPRSNIVDAINTWNSNSSYTGVMFVPRTTQLDYITFNTNATGCSSSVGRAGGAQAVNLSPDCGYGNVLHELGHAIGLFHEQSRNDRNTYIRVITANIDSEHAFNFNQYGGSGVDTGPYDYGSVMHYPRTAFSINGLPTIETIPPGIAIGQRNALSTGDLNGVRALYGGPPPPPQPCTTPSISAGQTVSGSLSSSDCRSPLRAAYADRFSFSGTSGQQIAITLSSQVFDTYLYLIGPNGSVIAQDDDGGINGGSRIPALINGFFSLPSSGTYIIEATSFGTDATGSYSLNLVAVISCTTPSISMGQTINGSLSVSDCHSLLRGNPAYADRFLFTGTSGQQISILLTSPSFDTYLYLIGPTGALVVGNDDGGGGSNSRIPDASGFLTLPFSGSYTIEATSFNNNSTGGYTLSLAAQSACSYAISAASQPFGPGGGTGSVGVTTSSGCNWSATSNASWIAITSGSTGSGSGTVSYSVTPNSGGPRANTVTIAGRVFTVTQTGGGLAVTSAIVSGKKLFVSGQGFSIGAEIYMNGSKVKKVSNDESTPTTLLVSKKGGKDIARGQTVILVVRNSNGSQSPEYRYTRP